MKIPLLCILLVLHLLLSQIVSIFDLKINPVKFSRLETARGKIYPAFIYFKSHLYVCHKTKFDLSS